MSADAALVATGGYGRGELYPCSDIDLLVLLPDEPRAAEQERLERLIHSFWDIGLEIGHSVRTVRDCVQAAASDITVNTTLLESRFLAGSRPLFAQMQAALGGVADPASFLKAKKLEQEQRHAKYQDSPYSLEPNLKEAPGGLRDLQVIQWIGRASGIGNRWSDLVAHGLFEREPASILESFLMMMQHPELRGMTAPTLRALWRARPRIDAKFRRDPRARLLFLHLLQQPRGIVHEFRRMNQYGILGRYLPEFGSIVGQMQHDLFHVYTVDQHILMVIRNLRRFTMPELAHEFPLCSELMSGFERRWLLYVAALYHDIAKGRGGDHSELGARNVRSFCRTHGLSSQDTDLVAFLVEHHLAMSSAAQKQDVHDPEMVRAFAERVGSERRLVALYLLTVADVRGTSPKVWNAWKAKLLEDLFRATRRVLTGEPLARDAALAEKQAEAARLLRLYALSDNVK